MIEGGVVLRWCYVVVGCETVVGCDGRTGNFDTFLGTISRASIVSALYRPLRAVGWGGRGGGTLSPCLSEADWRLRFDGGVPDSTGAHPFRFDTLNETVRVHLAGWFHAHGGIKVARDMSAVSRNMSAAERGGAGRGDSWSNSRGDNPSNSRNALTTRMNLASSAPSGTQTSTRLNRFRTLFPAPCRPQTRLCDLRFLAPRRAGC